MLATTAAAYWVSYPPACGWATDIGIDAQGNIVWTSVYHCHNGGVFWVT